MWYLDIRTSNHMCGKIEMFTELDKIKGKVSSNDNSKIVVEGKCTIMICLKNNACQFISNVYHALKMSSNILSLRQLLEKGYTIHIKDLSLVLRDMNNQLSGM